MVVAAAAAAAAAGVAVAVGAAAAPKVKPVPVAVAVAEDAGIGAAKSVAPNAGVAWVVAGGAGVDEGLIPKVNPPPWLPATAAVEVGCGWV